MGVLVEIYTVYLRSAFIEDQTETFNSKVFFYLRIIHAQVGHLINDASLKFIKRKRDITIIY